MAIERPSAQDCLALVSKISSEYQTVLKENLAGIYLHGSLAFDCFLPSKSDIDFIVVVRRPISLEVKISLIQCLLNHLDKGPAKGFEMSVVLQDVCSNFVHPTPYELHFSNVYLEECQKNIVEYCTASYGIDYDLAAHFTVLHTVGTVICGLPIKAIFAPVPQDDYLDSIQRDVANSLDDLDKRPGDVILNLCRVLAYIKTGQVLSKQQGGQWGLNNLGMQYTGLLQSALSPFVGEEKELDMQKAVVFCKELLNQLK